ncbi:hypothetical protein ACHAWU_004624 [Discostella pseudostelligera]|uniref:DDE Tnp4 domain-containing protein n=1 Tax=Discostella pseudostelligera TaxID=259834 RepID=A0ABD3MAI8_9STRA
MSTLPPRCITDYAYAAYYDGCDDDDDNDDDDDDDDDGDDSGGCGGGAHVNKSTDLYDGPLDDFNGYRVLETLDDVDWTGLADVQLLLLAESKSPKRQKQVKVKYDRTDWWRHAENLVKTNRFHKQHRMPKEHFDYLVDALRDCLTVDRLRSMNSTSGNEPIIPEMIVACGLRYLGLASNPYDLSQIYGISDSSVHRCINSFMDAIDFNTECKELQISLPDPTSKRELRELEDKWRKVSTAHGIMGGFLGAIDGWLPRIEMPWEVNNQVDYFSGHYQCYGLNVQAMCDPDLIFMFMSVTAPGKVNDVRAFNRCNILLEWLDALPTEYFIGGDNAYPLSQKVLIPFSGSAALDDDNLTYNFYFSQLRIRIEMAFGRFTTKWRILRSTMHNSLAKTAKLIDVCAKLHNFCTVNDSNIHGVLDALPTEYFIGGDNAYPLSQKVLIPFSGSAALDDDNLTYNFYFSQLRIRIEMAFGRFTTKWRILRSTMHNSLAKTAKLIDVCAKLHNFCIRMQQKDGKGRVGFLPDYNTNLGSFGIAPLDDGPLRTSEYGYLATVDEESVIADDAMELYDENDADVDGGDEHDPIEPHRKYPTLEYDDMRRRLILNEIKEFGMQRPQHNIDRNANRP